MPLTQPTRRQFLRAAGVTVALPLLDANRARGSAPADAPPKRMVAMCFALGLHAPNLIPAAAGRGFAPTPYLESLGKDALGRVTVVSGTSHPEVTVGHASDWTFLTAARHPGAPSFRNSVSLDQYMVQKLKPDTRFPSLVLGTRSGTLSFGRSGVGVPAESKPSSVFSRLFVNGSPSQVATQIQRLEDGQSVMDAVVGPAKRLQARASAPDRERLDQYFSAVRDVETRLVRNREWARKPKPKVSYAAPRDVADPNDDVTRLKLMLDLVWLAFQTDSTRIVTLFVGGSNSVQPIEGVTMEYHGLSHHGQDPEKLEQLAIVQKKQMAAVGDFLGKMSGTKEQGGDLLDHTAVLFGSAMGNASSHNCKNLPIVLAGGGFKHGQHIAFDKENNTPLCRLYVSLLQRMGVEADQFATGKGTLPGLEFS